MKNTLFFILGLGCLTALYSCQDDDPIVDLPLMIQEYISNNYPDFKVEEMEPDTLCTGVVVTEVSIEGPDDVELELIFDTEESFLFSESEIESTELPIEVSNSINANYNTYSAEDTERLDMSDGTDQFEVELKNGTSQLMVLFDAMGTVLCEEVDDE